MEVIYHITSRRNWRWALEAGEYRSDSLGTEGFIHCSKRSQVLRVADAFYQGQADLILLIIDPGRLAAELCWEPGSDKPDEQFPHIYGPLNLKAVVQTLDFPQDPGGGFHLPVV